MRRHYINTVQYDVDVYKFRVTTSKTRQLFSFFAVSSRIFVEESFRILRKSINIGR